MQTEASMSSSTRTNSRRDFPADIVEEILARLSKKDVLRCKLLSKPYYDLIQSPRFIHKYFLLNGSSYINKIITLVKNPETDSINDIVSILPCHSDVYVPAPAKLPNIEQLILIGSSNGLLCARLVHSDASTRKNSFLLWNPATKEHIILPHPPYDICRAIGFGYNARSGDYKLVKIWEIGGDSNAVIECWSKSTNSWSTIRTGSRLLHTVLHTTRPEGAGVLVREKLYWLASTSWNRIHGDYSPTGRTLVWFDTVNDSFSTKLTLPDATGYKAYSIIDLMGSLAVSARPNPCCGEPLMFKFDIWVLDDNVWTKRLSIGGTFLETVIPTGIYVNGRFLMSQIGCGHKEESRYFLYDPPTKEEEDLPHMPIISTCPWYRPLIYHESLASLN